jgi:hypothetical protein
LLRTCADLSRFVAAAAVALLAIRFSYVAVTLAMATAPSSVDAVALTETARPRPEDPEGAPVPSAPRSGPSVRMSISVLVGGDRAEVFIAGRKVGLTPFLGDVPCKRPSEVAIEVVPAQGPPLTFTRRCRAGLTRITEPDPPGVEVP